MFSSRLMRSGPSSWASRCGVITIGCRSSSSTIDGVIAEHEALLLEKDDAAEPAIEELLEQERGHGVAQGLLRVMKPESFYIGNGQVRKRDDLKWFEVRVETAIDLVGQQDVERNVRVMRAKRSREHARERQVALRNNRAGGDCAQKTSSSYRFTSILADVTWRTD